jgi:hypothetical protein
MHLIIYAFMWWRVSIVSKNSNTRTVEWKVTSTKAINRKVLTFFRIKCMHSNCTNYITISWLHEMRRAVHRKMTCVKLLVMFIFKILTTWSAWKHCNLLISFHSFIRRINLMINIISKNIHKNSAFFNLIKIFSFFETA